MAISSSFISEQANSSSLAVIKEFIYSYIDPSEIDIWDSFPILDENFILNKPILVLEDMNGSKKYAGLGRMLTNGDKGQKKVVEFMASWIINDQIGGAGTLRYLADILEYIFFAHATDLYAAGLKKPKCGSMTTIPKTSGSIFWGGRHLITAEVMIVF